MSMIATSALNTHLAHYISVRLTALNSIFQYFLCIFHANNEVGSNTARLPFRHIRNYQIASQSK
jgi:hypothetical protein